LDIFGQIFKTVSPKPDIFGKNKPRLNTFKKTKTEPDKIGQKKDKIWTSALCTRVKVGQKRTKMSKNCSISDTLLVKVGQKGPCF
jgi:hypothetical protein